MSEQDCSICCENIVLQAKYKCSHKICYKCATRLVYLYNDKKCPICKSEDNTPFFEKPIENKKTTISLESSTDSLLKTFKNIKIEGKDLETDNKSCKAKKEFNSTFQNEEIQETVKGLLLIKCKECHNKFQCKKDLMSHFKKEHSLLLCCTCVEQGHRFWYEYSAYTPEALGQHRRGLSKEPGFDGHIHCPFCNIWLYSKDTAKKHCIQEHQICTVCDILGKKLNFFKNFSELEQHYRSQHFCCNQAICIQNHCYVYAYKSELCAHSITHHGVEMQLSEVALKNEVAPQAFSLFTRNQDVEQQDNLYSTGVNILNPLVNKPYFPAFSSNPSSLSASKNQHRSNTVQLAVPSFLDRKILHDIKDASSRRDRVLQEITTVFYKEIGILIEKYISGTKPLKELISEIEECLDKESCLKILQRAPFFDKKQEIEEFMVQYKKELKFPVLKKSIKPVSECPLVKGKPKGPGFRIIDFSKKKK